MTEVNEEKARDAFDIVAEKLARAVEKANTTLPDDPYSGRDWMAGALRDAFQHEATRTAMLEALRGAVVAQPEKVIGHLFERSGHLIKSTTAELIDKMVADAISEGSPFMKAWIEDYISANRDRLIIAALAHVMVHQMTGNLDRIVNQTALATDQMISQAFMNARMNRGSGY